MQKFQKILFWSAAFILFLGFVYLLRDVLLPFVAGIALAFFLDPVATRLQRRIRSRTMAVVVVFSVFALFCLIALLIVFPIVQRQMSLFINNVPVYASLLWGKIEPYMDELKKMFPKQTADLRQTVVGHLSGAAKMILKTVGGVLSGSMALLNLLSLVIITPIVAFYLLRDWTHFCGTIRGLLPRNEAPTIRSLLRQINDILSGFIRGQATVCLCLSAYYAITLSLTGLDLGLLIGLCIGAVSFIPYVGSTLGFLLSVGLAAIQFDDYGRLIAVVVVFLCGQMLEGNVLTPKLVGEKVNLHPVWVMFSLLAGASLFGFLGVLIAVPVAAVIGVLVRFFIARYKESDIYLGTA